MLDLVLTLKCNNECIFCTGGYKESWLKGDMNFKYAEILNAVKDNILCVLDSSVIRNI